MTYEAAIAIAPATTVERLNDPAWRDGEPDRLMFDPSGLKLVRESVPVMVDHSEGNVVGSVKRLMRLEADGPWVCAIVEVTEKPDWLKRGTPASFAHICARMCSFGNPIVRSCFVKEVSILSPGVDPAEPRARVLHVREVEPLARRSEPEEVISGGAIIRRYFDNVPITVR